MMSFGRYNIIFYVCLRYVLVGARNCWRLNLSICWSKDVLSLKGVRSSTRRLSGSHRSSMHSCTRLHKTFEGNPTQLGSEWHECAVPNALLARPSGLISQTSGNNKTEMWICIGDITKVNSFCVPLKTSYASIPHPVLRK